MTQQPTPPPTYQNPGYPPPHQPRRKSFVARHKLLTVLGALVVLGGVIGVSTSGGSDTTASPANAVGAAGGSSSGGEGSAGGGSASGIGTPVRDGKFEFTVTSVGPGVPSIGTEPLEQKAQGKFVVVRLTVSNIGDKAQLFDQSSQKLVDNQGRQLSSDPTAGIYLDDQNFLAQINPGNKIEGVLVFDIPLDAVPKTVELHDSFLSGGVPVTLTS
ncbi:MAG: DUF4352 domain-containing protein [Mycobacteriaceae bacterium]